MAKKAQSGDGKQGSAAGRGRGAGRRKPAAGEVDVGKKAIDTALKLAAERGWRDLSLAEIAEAAGLDLAQLYPRYSSKQAILEQLSRRIDAEVLAESEEDALHGPARDRLFDVLMRRFDALRPYKEGLGEIVYDLLRDPVSSAAAALQLQRTMACMLEAAGLSSTGLRGALRIQVLSGIYLMTLRVWLRDDTEDLSKTMAALDGYLRRIESLIERLPRRGGRRRAA